VVAVVVMWRRIRPGRRQIFLEAAIPDRRTKDSLPSLSVVQYYQYCLAGELMMMTILVVVSWMQSQVRWISPCSNGFPLVSWIKFSKPLHQNRTDQSSRLALSNFDDALMFLIRFIARTLPLQRHCGQR
jgi:hypothetical protein